MMKAHSQRMESRGACSPGTSSTGVDVVGPQLSFPQKMDMDVSWK